MEREYQQSVQLDQNPDFDTDDIIAIYKNDVGNYRLLRCGEEIALAQRIASGDVEAKNDLITSNLRQVINIAKKKSHFTNAPITDYIQDGNEGLIKATEKFNPDKGTRFSTYATFWIKQYVRKADLTNDRNVRVPINLRGDTHNLIKKTDILAQELGREPTSLELSVYLGKPINSIESLSKISKGELSLDEPINPGLPQSETYADVVEDKNADPVLDIEKKDLNEQVKTLLESTLNPREQLIIELKFGLKDGERHTFDEIRDIVENNFSKITLERVRQITNRSIEKLRVKADKMQLYEYCLSED